jgi:hypothetical protein
MPSVYEGATEPANLQTSLLDGLALLSQDETAFSLSTATCSGAAARP